MVEESRPWPGTTVGDAGPYSDDDWDNIWEVVFGSGASPYNDRGVIRNWANELEVTDGGANTADVDTGAALVHGKFYKNDAVVNVTVPSSTPGNWREDLICLQSSWVAQTIRIARHANPAENVGYPAPTQTDGVTWEIPLAAVRIDSFGTITLITDLRDYVSDLMQPKQLQIDPLIGGAGAPVFTQFNLHCGVALDNDNDEAGFEFVVPDDFKSLVEAEIRFIPEVSGNIDWDTTMRAAACGEAAQTHSDSCSGAALAVTADEIECLDLSTCFDGIMAGDSVGFIWRVTALGITGFLVMLKLLIRYK